MMCRLNLNQELNFMSCKIKSTLNFVKSWPTENRREDTPFTILSSTQDEANAEITKIMNAWVSTEADSDGKVVYQCYLKNVLTEQIYEAKRLPITTCETVLTRGDVLDYIINNQVRLVPTPLVWVTEDGELADFVTHDVYFGKERYQGMSVYDCVHAHINKK